MTTLVPTHASALVALLRRAESRLSAEDVAVIARAQAQSFGALVPSGYPGRPAVVTMNDDELLDAYAALRRGDKVSGDKMRQLSYFATWRAAAWDSEARSGFALCRLLDAARVLGDRVLVTIEDAPEGASEEKLQAVAAARARIVEDVDLAATLWMHVREQWGVVPEEVPAEGTWFDLRDWCLQRMKRFDLMPTYLRTTRRPRGGIPGHASKESDGQYDDQGGFGW